MHVESVDTRVRAPGGAVAQNPNNVDPREELGDAFEVTARLRPVRQSGDFPAPSGKIIAVFDGESCGASPQIVLQGF